MALMSLPPDGEVKEPPKYADWLGTPEQQEYNRWLDSAISQLRTSERSETFDNLASLLEGEAYYTLSTSQSEGGYPSPSAFMTMAPNLRKARLNRVVQSADELEESMVAFLTGIAEEDPERAEALVGELSRGVTGDFRNQLLGVLDIAKHAKAEAEQEKKQHDLSVLKDVPDLIPHLKKKPPYVHAPPLVPELEALAPKEPKNRDPRKKPERAIADASAQFDRGNGGDADAGP